MSVLSVDGLSIEYHGRGETIHAVANASFALGERQTIGLVGESGCGKSTVAHAILGLLPPTASTTSGTIRFRGNDLLALDERAMRELRWRQIAFVPQSAINSLNPVATLFDLFKETSRTHGGDRAALRGRAEALFRRVELDPDWLDRYPHELSGGMRQRAIIALSLLFEPILLIADEPTTGLDVIVQRQVLDLLREIKSDAGMSLVLISHDIGVIAEMCDMVAVMYAGEVMEAGPTSQVLDEPGHPYTMGLERAFPDIREPQRPLVSIPGYPPRLTAPIVGCAFVERCPFARDICRSKKPDPHEIGPGRLVACHFAAEAARMRSDVAEARVWEAFERA